MDRPFEPAERALPHAASTAGAPEVVLKTIRVQIADHTRYLPLEFVPLAGASTIVLAARVDRGMDDSGEHQQLHLHLALRVGDGSGDQREPAAPCTRPTTGAQPMTVRLPAGAPADGSGSESYQDTNIISLRAVAGDGGTREVRPNLDVDLEQGVSLRTRVFYPTPVATRPNLSLELAPSAESHQRDIPAASSQLDEVRFTRIVVLLDGQSLPFYVTPDGSNEPQNAMRVNLSQGLDFQLQLQPDNGSSPMGPGLELRITQAAPKP